MEFHDFPGFQRKCQGTVNRAGPASSISEALRQCYNALSKFQPETSVQQKFSSHINNCQV